MTAAKRPAAGSHVEVWGPLLTGEYVLSDRYAPDDQKQDYCTHKDPRALVRLARDCDCQSICHSYDMRLFPM